MDSTSAPLRAPAGAPDRLYQDTHDEHVGRRAGTADADPVRKLPRICFVGMSNLTVLAPELDARGAAGEPVQQTLLAKAFARLGYPVSMLTADCGQADGEVREGVRVFKAYAPDAGVPVLRFVHPRFTGLWSALRRADADVYYVSCAGAIVGQVALFCRRHNKRFVYRIVSDADCAAATLRIRYWRDRRLYEYGLRRASGVLAQSVRQQQLLRQNYGLSSLIAGLLVEQAGAGVDLANRDVDVLWVSNIRKLKRPDLLFGLAEAVPELAVHMAGGVVASEPQSFAAAKLRASGMPNVTFHGAVPYREVNALYRRARVFVNTSDIEGFPNAYLQAWASGAPVVSFFDPDGVIAREGLGVAATSHEQMADAVRLLARDHCAWRAASARCLAFIRREYGEDAVLQPYLQLVDPAERTIGGAAWAPR